MKRAVALALIACAAAGGAQPVYREGQPAVLERAAPDENANWQAAVAKFSRAYADSGRPRMLVMWHRAVSDRISDEQRITRSATSAGVLPRDNYAQEVVIRWQERQGRAGCFGARGLAAEYAAGLAQTLLTAGVRLVDRNVAIRMTALKGTTAGKSAATMDNATVEAQAFSDMADQILQVQLLPDAQAAVGWRARLTLIDVATGRMVADSMADAAQQRGAAGGERVWVATDKGFETRAQAVPLSRIARSDVMALMKAMAP
jgi:hypothetical protein